MLSQGFKCWLRCQDQLNACSDKRYDSRSRILPLSEPLGVFARYQHIFTLLEADSELSGKPSPQSPSIMVTESKVIFTALLMQIGTVIGNKNFTS